MYPRVSETGHGTGCYFDRTPEKLVLEGYRRWAAGFETGSFQGVVGPAGMPKDVVAKLNGELTRVLNTAEMKERFAKQGTEVRTGTSESFGAWLGTEQAKWAKVVRESGVKFD